MSSPAAAGPAHDFGVPPAPPNLADAATRERFDAGRRRRRGSPRGNLAAHQRLKSRASRQRVGADLVPMKGEWSGALSKTR